MLSAREIFGEILLPGDAGTHQTLDRMRALVDAGAQLPETRQAVAAALATALPRNPQSELSALLEWVQGRWHYVRDPTTVELVQAPALMLREIRRRGEVQGDCDDAAVLFGALAESAGYPTRFVVQGPDGDLFRHVVIEVQTGGRWLAVDPSQGVHGLGWAPPAGREEREMRYRTKGLRGLGIPPSEVDSFSRVPSDVVFDPLVISDVSGGQSPSSGEAAPSANGGSGGWSLADIFSGVRQVLTTVVPLAERYGVVTPVIGYNADGTPIYATRTLPVSGATGATYTGLTQEAFLGLSWAQVLMLGGAAILVFSLMRK